MSKINYSQVFGLHAVRQVFTNDISAVLEIWVQETRQENKLQDLIAQARQQNLSVQMVPKKTLDKLTDNANHQGVVIRCKLRPSATENDLETCLAQLTVPPFLLVLDGVQDPHNLGACLRTADAAGVHAVIVPKNRACSLSATVRKVASGAADTVPLFTVTNLATTLRWLKQQGIWLIAASADGSDTLFHADLTGALALVLGAEGTGLRRLTQETCDKQIKIPMLGTVESLNVSVATAICLYEAVRQRTSRLSIKSSY